ncbi:MAG: EthD family reductase [Halolamina sp.]
MVKMVVLLVRAESLSYEEFRSYWEEEHVPLVEELPDVERYVTSHPTDPEKSAYDGVAEVYFEDMAALGAAFDSDAGEALLADAEEFSDQEAGEVLYMDEETRFVAE